MKKRFACGHLGKGKYCHRCELATELVDRSKDEKKDELKKKFKEEAERLFKVPNRTGAVAMPTAPVPA